MALTDTFDNPQSRVEAILQNAMGAEHEVVPQSRVEELLERLDGYLENIEGKITDQDEEIIAAVNAWLEENFSGEYSVTDTTLSFEGMAADAKKTGDEISELKEDFTQMESDGLVPSAEQILSDKGVTDSVPYHYRKTGGDGADRLYDQIVGGTVCWNQLVSNNVIHGTINSGMSATDLQSAQLKANHKYLYQLNLSRQSTGGNQNVDFQIALRFLGSATTIYHFDQSSNPHVVTVDSTQFSSLTSYTYSDTFGNDVTYALNLFDLTAMFGSTIADYIYQLEQTTAGAGVAFFKRLFPNDYYEYNAGELISVSGLSEHKMVGFNQWDEEWELGGFSNGVPSAQTDRIRSKNFIPVISGMTYYVAGARISIPMYDANKNYLKNWNNGSFIGANESFTVGDDVAYIKFMTALIYGTTYNHDICINLSDPTKNGTYEPYKAHSYPLDSDLTLRGIPKLVDGKMCFDGDTYDADGTVTRRYGVVDLGTLKWARDNTSGIFYTSPAISNIKSVPANSIANIKCSQYVTVKAAGSNEETDKSISVGYLYISNGVNVKDTSYSDIATFKAAMSGVMLVYELATPTTEKADPYQHLQQCDPNGTEEYVSTGIVPIGHNSFYPENLRAKVEQLPWNFANLIAPTESTFTATRNYTTGALFIVQNVLYKATSNIANGGAITPNTNCTATTLAEIISALA